MMYQVGGVALLLNTEPALVRFVPCKPRVGVAAEILARHGDQESPCQLWRELHVYELRHQRNRLWKSMRGERLHDVIRSQLITAKLTWRKAFPNHPHHGDVRTVRHLFECFQNRIAYLLETVP